MGASSVVLLAYLKHFGRAVALDARLEVACNRFDDWCRTNGNTTCVRGFSKDDLDFKGSKLSCKKNTACS